MSEENWGSVPKKPTKFHSLLFANFLNDSIAFTLLLNYDLWFFFPFFLPTVFCHSFIVSFYSFKYESASTISFFRQKLWKLPIILPSTKYNRNDYGYNGCTKFGKLVYQVVLVSAKNQLVEVWKKMNLELHFSQRSCRKN